MCESLKLVIASPDAGRNPSRYHPPTQRRRPVRQMPNPIGECPTISAHQGVWAWAYDHRRQVHRTYLRIFTEANQILTSEWGEYPKLASIHLNGNEWVFNFYNHAGD